MLNLWFFLSQILFLRVKFRVWAFQIQNFPEIFVKSPGISHIFCCFKSTQKTMVMSSRYGGCPAASGTAGAYYGAFKRNAAVLGWQWLDHAGTLQKYEQNHCWLMIISMGMWISPENMAKHMVRLRTSMYWILSHSHWWYGILLPNFCWGKASNILGQFFRGRVFGWLGMAGSSISRHPKPWLRKPWLRNLVNGVFFSKY